ncbi:hypothetical protein C479_05947 [Halovivax asiaticus JCM 14624]|uniref:Uncharacterized protein n=1 Tax=Halovivax asiaticus JCM 14624 TaxID=1227490 RepID=M0BQN1_9EURY|nr:hypothetical protein [Halovivax asiaticus]ELZ11964.1 hypothetical protein C479_05947 [Halovivax asiaticus JCM 14624]
MTDEPSPKTGSTADSCVDETDGGDPSDGTDASADRAGRTIDSDELRDGECDLQPDDERAGEERDERTGGERDERAADAAHLRDVPVGSGCTEIWEHLAERREDDA